MSWSRMKSPTSNFLLTLFIVCISSIILIPFANAESYRGDFFIDSKDGLTHFWQSAPPFIASGNFDEQGRPIFIPYIISNEEHYVKYESGSLSWIFSKDSCTLKLFSSGKINPSTQPIIKNISWTLQELINGTWINSQQNSFNCDVQINELSDNTIQLIAKQGDATIGYKEIELKQVAGNDLESFLKSPPATIDGQTFGFAESHVKTQTLFIDGNIFVDQTNSTTKFVADDFISDVGNDIAIETTNDNGSVLFITKNSIHNALTDVTVKNYSADELQTVYDFHNALPLSTGDVLIIDPTYGYTEATIGDARSNNSSASGSAYIGHETTIEYRGWGYWNTTSIPDTSHILTVKVRYDIDYRAGSQNCNWNSIEGNLSSQTVAQRYIDIGNGTTFVSNSSQCDSIADDKILDLGSSAVTDLQNELSIDDEWGVGIAPVTTSGDNLLQISGSKRLELQVTYVDICTSPSNLKVLTQNATGINLSWTRPSNSCQESNYKIFESKSGGAFTLKQTIGNTTNTNFNTLDSATQYAFKVSATNIIGTYSSNSTTITNSTLPSAPIISTATPISPTAINVVFSDNSTGTVINWKKLRLAICNTGSWIIFDANSTVPPRYENITSLSPLTNYCIQVAEGNQGGFGQYSANKTATTYGDTSATVSLTSDVVGDVVKLIPTVTITNASPSPVTVSLLEGFFNNTLQNSFVVNQSIASGGSHTFSSEIFLQLYNNNTQTAKVRATITTWNGTIQFNSTTSNVIREIDPTPLYVTAITPSLGLVYWDIDDTDATQRILKINRPINSGYWLANCKVVTGLKDAGLTWYNESNVGFFKETMTATAGQTLYISCYNPNQPLFNTQSSGNVTGILAGFTGFDDTLGSWFGLPMIFMFVFFLAGLFGGRQSGTSIVIFLAGIACLGAIGLIVVDQLVWGLVLTMGVFGLMASRIKF